MILSSLTESNSSYILQLKLPSILSFEHSLKRTIYVRYVHLFPRALFYLPFFDVTNRIRNVFISSDCISIFISLFTRQTSPQTCILMIENWNPHWSWMEFHVLCFKMFVWTELPANAYGKFYRVFLSAETIS